MPNVDLQCPDSLKPYRLLALMVLARGRRDTTFTESPMLAFWCDVAGLPVEEVRKAWRGKRKEPICRDYFNLPG